MIVRNVLLLIGAIVGIQALAWTIVLLWFRRRHGGQKASLVDELRAAGETIVRGPESATYRGATTGYSQVSGTGVIVLTNRRLLFRKLTGGRIDVPLDRIASIREAKVFLSSYRSGRLHLILRLRDGSEVGFIVADQPGWMAALAEAVGA